MFGGASDCHRYGFLMVFQRLAACSLHVVSDISIVISKLNGARTATRLGLGMSSDKLTPEITADVDGLVQCLHDKHSSHTAKQFNIRVAGQLQHRQHQFTL